MNFYKACISVLLVWLSLNNLISQSGCSFEPADPWTKCTSHPYLLVFEDNFNGNELDQSKWWTYHEDWGIPYGRFGDCSSLLWRSDDMVTVGNGVCTLRVERFDNVWSGNSADYDNCGGEVRQGEPWSFSRNYKAGMIKTKELWNTSEYIKMEASVKVPLSRGVNPAFWAFNGDEVDVFEFLETRKAPNSKIFHTNIHNGPNNECAEKYEADQDLSFAYHTYAVEINPFYITWTLDGNVIREVKRFANRSGDFIDLCNSNDLPKYQIDAYPSEGDWWGPIFTMELTNRSLDEIDSPSEMLIDWVKVYIQKPLCNPEGETDDEVILANTYSTWDTDRTIGNRNVIVEDNATLDIRNCSVFFGEGQSIVLRENAKLILSGATLTTCASADSWRGITMRGNQSPEVIMNGWSRIEKAYIGINTFFVKNPKIDIKLFSGFDECDYGIYLGDGDASQVNLSARSYFENCSTGILAQGSSGGKLDRIEFYDCSIGIDAINSSFELSDGNAFHNGDYGIVMGGTHPTASGILIGDFGQGWNYFLGQSTHGIWSTGSTSPLGINITNCRFSNSGTKSVGIDGANHYTFTNNLLENFDQGILANAAGGALNRSSCNQFNNSTDVSIGFYGDNSFTTFFENHFSGNQLYQVGAGNAQLASNIGSSFEGASNCFSANGIDIFSGSIPVIMGNSVPFDYHYYDDNNSTACQEPFNPGNYGKIEATDEGDYCSGQIGVSRLNIPGIGGTILNIGSGFNPTLVCTTCVIDSILHHNQQYINGVQSLNNISSRSSNDVGSELIEKLRTNLYDWASAGLYIAVELNDYVLAEQMIAPLTDWYWKQMYFGLQIEQEDWVEAQLVLDVLPQQTQDQIYFKEVQEMNLKFLHFDPNIDSFSVTEIDQLRLIANSVEPTSGYAKTLLRLITGEEIPMFFPELGSVVDDRNTELAKLEDRKGDLLVFPNPVTNQSVNISHSERIMSIKIYDFMGQEVFASYNLDGKNSVVSLDKLSSGIYTIKVFLQNGGHKLTKLIKH